MYATGDTLEFYDMPTVRRIVAEAADEDYLFSELVRGIVGSEQFRMRRAPDASGAPASIADSSVE
jgi:hypothetical protein